MTVDRDSRPPERRGSPSDGRFERGHVLVPLLGDDPPDRLVAFGVDVARERGLGVLLANVVSVPWQTPLDASRPRQDAHGTLEELLTRLSNDGIETRGVVYFGRRPVESVLDLVDTHGSEVALLRRSSAGRRRANVRRSPERRIAASASCDVVLGRLSATDENADSILAPVRYGPHTPLVVRTARAIASRRGLSIHVLHVVAEDATDGERLDASKFVRAIVEQISGGTTVTSEVETGDVATAVLDRTRAHDIAVVGAPTKDRLRRLAFGSTVAAVRDDADCDVLTVRQGHPLFGERRPRPADS
jgi:nucleotide-binding universal stress UspA family protein